MVPNFPGLSSAETFEFHGIVEIAFDIGGKSARSHEAADELDGRGQFAVVEPDEAALAAAIDDDLPVDPDLLRCLVAAAAVRRELGRDVQGMKLEGERWALRIGDGSAQLAGFEAESVAG